MKDCMGVRIPQMLVADYGTYFWEDVENSLKDWLRDPVW